VKEQADEQCVIEFDQHSSAAKHGAASWSDLGRVVPSRGIPYMAGLARH
jgi:hypothetical protein